MEWGHSHDWEQDQWNGIETVLQPALRTVVQVKHQCPQQVGDKGEEEEVGNETFLLVDIPLLLLCQLRDILSGEGEEER